MIDYNYNISNTGFATVSSFPTQIQAVGITTTGFPVQIICTGDGYPPVGNSIWQRLRIYRDGTAIGNTLHIESPSPNMNTTVAITWIDTPTAGVHTYSLFAISGSGTFSYGEVSPIVMTAEEKAGIKGQSWLRRDISSPNVYYGYNSNENASNSDSTWAIKRINTSGSVETVKWANGGSNFYLSVWDDRVSCFVTPSAITGFTWSLVTYPLNKGINMSWNSSSGVDKYRILVKNGDIIYSDGGHRIYNNPNLNDDVVTKEVTTNSYFYRWGQVGVTYSVTLKALNVIGMTSVSFTMSVV
jgi:hypothetical protein